MVMFVFALVSQKDEELLKCVLVDYGEQFVTLTIDGIVEMLMLCADSLDSIHLELLQEGILTLVQELDQYFSIQLLVLALSLLYLTVLITLIKCNLLVIAISMTLVWNVLVYHCMLCAVINVPIV